MPADHSHDPAPEPLYDTDSLALRRATGELDAESTLPHARQIVWDWHTRPAALARLTPPWEAFTLVSREGDLSNARVEARVGGLRWVSKHEAYREGAQFVDRMRHGPFRSFVHTHGFADAPGGGTRYTDSVRYALPLGALGRAVAGSNVAARLVRMFRYRHAVLVGDLARHASHAGPPLRIAVSGASGLIGSTLCAMLETGGHRVLRLVRGQAGPGERSWDPQAAAPAPGLLDGVDVCIHLAGAGIADARWTDARKELIRVSRRQGTTLLAQAAAQSDRLQAFVTASGIGYYGDQGDALLNEHSALGTGFLAEVCDAWEGATQAAHDAGKRVAQLRLGLVLAQQGGALARMLPAAQMGLIGPLGAGQHWQSWVSLDDAVDAFHLAATDARVSGPLNVVAPAPVRQRDFATTLASVLKRPSGLPTPRAALRTLFGELADEALLASQRVQPAGLEALGFRYRWPTLEAALRHSLGRW